MINLQRRGIVDTYSQFSFSRSSLARDSRGRIYYPQNARFEVGKFGQAVLIEEGTTNLISNPGFENDFVSWGTWSSPSVAEIITIDRYEGTKSFHVIANGYNGGKTQSVTVTGGATYTVSVYVKRVSGRPKVMQLISNPSGTTLGDKEATGAIGQWVRYSMTVTIPTNDNSLQILLGGAYDGGTAEAYYDAVQVEAKPYATSFINGTRAADLLTVPTTGIFPDVTNFSIELFAKADTVKTDGYQGIFGGRNIGGAPPVDLLIHTNNNLYLFYYDSTETSLFINTGYSISNRTSWHYYAVTFSNGTVKLFVDGVKVKEATITLKQYTGIGNFYLGRSISNSEYWNGLIDNLRISNIARSDTEIANAYNSGQPLQADANTTLLLNFDGPDAQRAAKSLVI